MIILYNIRMNVLMVTSEAVPFFKTGGLADMVTSLSSALLKNGDDVRIVMPLYDEDNQKFSVELMGAADIALPHSTETIGFGKALDGTLTYYFILHPIWGKRKGIYGDENGEYDDTLKRQMIFTKGIEKLISYANFKPDVIHAHDWMTGLVPYYFKKSYKTVFTIHNIGYQGKTSAFDAAPIGFVLDESSLERENDGSLMINSLKSAILNATAITTVSPSYSKEILTPQFGEGLESYLKLRENSLFGILNGIDETVWTPSNDKEIKHTYSIKDMSGKEKCKKAVLKEFGFDENDKRPLIAIISRLAWQKGFFEVLKGEGESAIENILSENSCLFAVIGTGDKELEGRFKSLSEKYSNLSFKNMFSNRLSHLLEAGSDFFFMPSVYEPCGLNQMYSLKYGSVPIVNSTGGLKDTVIDASRGAKANGFVMDNLDKETIKNTLHRAIMCYTNNKEYATLQKNGMKASFSWDNGAKEYEAVYKSIIKK